MGAPPFAKPLEATNSKQQVRHLDASLSEDGEDYETDLYEVDVIPEKYAQSVFSTAENPRGTRVGRTFFSHLKLGITKGMTKSIRIQLDSASTCNTLPENFALSLIPPGKKLKDYLTPSRATLFTYDNSKLTPLGKLELLAETTAEHHLLTFHILRDSQIPGKPPLLSGSDCVGLVKICADEVHSISSPLSTVNSQKTHLMADNSRPRDVPMQPEPTSSRTCLKRFSS